MIKLVPLPAPSPGGCPDGIVQRPAVARGSPRATCQLLGASKPSADEGGQLGGNLVRLDQHVEVGPPGSQRRGRSAGHGVPAAVGEYPSYPLPHGGAQ